MIYAQMVSKTYSLSSKYCITLSLESSLKRQVA
uniref:Uncharacterized protein n=1 Tax=Anguilla anguilla TaxID=7936 RepID=A0A0E9Y092_ANGAN